MVIKNAKIVLLNEVIEKGYLAFDNGMITEIARGECPYVEAYDAKGNIIMPGFIDVHIHGSCNIDFMSASANDYKKVSESLFTEGVTSYLATTLTSDFESLKQVCYQVKLAKKDNPSLLGLHLEGPYICEKYKGAQNEAFIRNPDIKELTILQEISDKNIKYITLAVEKPGAYDFIDKATKILHITCSVGHSDATFAQVEEAMKHGLTNVTHTHNAMSPHHHRNPGIVTAAMYFDGLYTEVISDGLHLVPESVKTFYKIVGPNRYMIITDSLKVKHSDVTEFDMFGLPAIKKNGAAYLTNGVFCGSLLEFDKGVKNLKKWTNASLNDLAKISSYNQAKSLHLEDRGELKVGKLADFVILNSDLDLLETYKLGKKVY